MAIHMKYIKQRGAYGLNMSELDIRGREAEEAEPHMRKPHGQSSSPNTLRHGRPA
jgi:hypothetical protein